MMAEAEVSKGKRGVSGMARGRARRYCPEALAVPLPEGFVEAMQIVLEGYTAELRKGISFLAEQLERPLRGLEFDVRVDRRYGSGKSPDVDDVRLTVKFHDRSGTKSCQRYTWVFADPPKAEGEVRVRGYSRRSPGWDERRNEDGWEEAGDASLEEAVDVGASAEGVAEVNPRDDGAVVTPVVRMPAELETEGGCGDASCDAFQLPVLQEESDAPLPGEIDPLRDGAANAPVEMTAELEGEGRCGDARCDLFQLPVLMGESGAALMAEVDRRGTRAALPRDGCETIRSVWRKRWMWGVIVVLAIGGVAALLIAWGKLAGFVVGREISGRYAQGLAGSRCGLQCSMRWFTRMRGIGNAGEGRCRGIRENAERRVVRNSHEFRYGQCFASPTRAPPPGVVASGGTLRRGSDVVDMLVAIPSNSRLSRGRGGRLRRLRLGVAIRGSDVAGFLTRAQAAGCQVCGASWVTIAGAAGSSQQFACPAWSSHESWMPNRGCRIADADRREQPGFEEAAGLRCSGVCLLLMPVPMRFFQS